MIDDDTPAGTDTTLPPPPPGPNQSSGWSGAVGLFGLGAVVAWVVTAFKAVSLWSDLREVADSFILDASAIQISQIADEAKIEILQYVVWSSALTVATLVLFALGVLNRLNRIAE